MFKKRSRATSNPAANPPSASASLAASKAFLQDRKSNAGLSSAAAAAALRTHPHPPTAVGDTVTKRMVRKSSISSHGSGSQQGPILRRHSSSGSMTERSFRVPSPNHSPILPDHAPPVPAVPKNVPTTPVQRRSSSLEPRRGGHQVGRGGGRGVSVDTGHRVGPSQRIVSLPQVAEYDQDGRRSVNFSRPISPPTTTNPSPTKAKSGHSGWFAAPVVNADQSFRGAQAGRPKTSDISRQYDAQNTWQSIQNAADRPVSTKRSQMSHGVEGARLNTGSMRSKPSGSSVPYRPVSVDPKSQDAVYDPSTRSFIRKQDAMERHRQMHEEEEPVVQYTPPRKPQSPPQQYYSQHSPLRYEHVAERSPSPPRQQYIQHSPARFQERSPPPRERTLASPISFHVNAEIAPSPPQQRPARDSPIQYEDVRELSPTQHQREAAEPETVHTQPPYNEPQIEGEEYHYTSHVPTHDTSAVLARQASEDYAGADIKPATDANTSRKLEAPYSEPPADREVPISSTTPATHDIAHPRVSTPVNQTVDTLSGRGRGSIRSDRNSSMSPQRNAHFASQSLELPNGFRHQPPARSISPAKSALKSSPSTSRRGSSPVVNSGRYLAVGSVSEPSEIASEEGSAKKKRGTRVSFEEATVIAGTSAHGEMETPTSPTGLGQSKWNTDKHEDGLEDLMKPRAALPSFGSIRGKDRRGSDGEVAEKVTETVSSSLSASVASIPGPINASSDHALAGIVAQDFASKKPTSHDPMPPEVTSVEGTGYYSDTSSSDTARYDDVSDSKPVTSEESFAEPKTLMTPMESTTPAESNPPADNVPVIALQPATPLVAQHWEPTYMQYNPAPAQTDKTETEPQAKDKRPFVPGGWDDEDSEPEEATLQPKPDPETVSAQPRISWAEPDPPRRSTTQESESSDDNDSIYSDAYEDLTDAEDGTFASIDQILESPIPNPPSGLMQSRFAETEAPEPPRSTTQNEYAAVVKNDASRAPDNEWEAARGHWGGVVDSHKKAQQDTQIPKPVPQTQTRVVKQRPKVAAPREEKIATPQARVGPVQSAKKSSPTAQTPAQPRKSALKKTTTPVQQAPSSEQHMRKTMRGSPAPQPATSPNTTMRKSMRSGTPTAAPNLATSRFNTPPVESKPPKGALQKKHIPASASAPRSRVQNASVPVPSKPMAIAPTYDSDSGGSVSSFQRERKQRRSSRGRNDPISMRRSMRSEPNPTMRATPTPRPISPPVASSPPPQAAFRKSMRASSPEPAAPKSSRFSIRSLSPGRKSKPVKSKSKASVPKAAKPAFSSRFGDSSDEDDDRPRHFQSRFADSDDDDDFEVPQGLTPVRGIPRRAGEEDGDSTDLEDEMSDDERPKDFEKSNGITNGLSKSKHPPELPSFDSGKKPKAKRGFFGLGKKKTSSPTPEAVSEPGVELPSPEATSDIPLPPTHHQREASRPLTPIGEDQDPETSASPAQRTRSPKLQRRNTPQFGRSTSDSWPLPSPSEDEVDRPQTSDGIGKLKAASLRPSLGKRFSSVASHVSQPPVPGPNAKTAIDPKTGKEVIVGKSGKKKKFQGLRRVFGLND